MELKVIVAPDALTANAGHIREHFQQNDIAATVAAVVKSNAAGHGLTAASDAFARAGIDHFCVGSMDEGIEVRTRLPEAHIQLITPWSPVSASETESLVEHRIAPFVGCVQQLKALNTAALRLNTRIPYYIDIDLGMGRSGYNLCGLKDALRVIRLCRDHAEPVGISGHFPVPEDRLLTCRHFRCISRAQLVLQRAGICLPLQVAASIAAILHPSTCGDSVRIGRLLYGVTPECIVKQCPDLASQLRPALALRGQITEVKTLRAGRNVGYGIGRLPRRTCIAILPSGYSSGYPRKMAYEDRAGEVLVQGQRCPILAVHMNTTVIDVTGQRHTTRVGSEVTLIGKDGEEEIPLEEAARNKQVSSSELLCALSALPHQYQHDS